MQVDVGLATAQGIDAGSFWANYLRGVVAMEQDRPSAAVDIFADAALARPERWEPYYGLSLAAHRAGRPGLARIAAEAMLERAPERRDILQAPGVGQGGAQGEGAGAGQGGETPSRGMTGEGF